MPAPLVSGEIVVGLHNVAVDFVNPLDRGRVPQAADDAFVTDVNAQRIFDVLQNDGNASDQLMPLSVSIVSGPTAGKIEVDSQTGRVAYVPGPEFVGLDKFQYQVRDKDGLSSNLATARIAVVDFERHPCAIRGTLWT